MAWADLTKFSIEALLDGLLEGDIFLENIEIGRLKAWLWLACCSFASIWQVLTSFNKSRPILTSLYQISSNLKQVWTILNRSRQISKSLESFWTRLDHGHLYTGQLCFHFVFRQVDIMGGNTWDPNYALGFDFLDHIFNLKNSG